MRNIAAFALLSLALAASAPAAKLTFEDRVELTRGLTAEYATAKVIFPRAKKALEFSVSGTWDSVAWARISQEEGTAARKGEMIQITKIDIESDRIVLQLNGGYNGGRKWYRGVRISGGPSNNPAPIPVGDGSADNAPFGTSVALLFHKPLTPIKATEVKKLLAPLLDFDKHSVTEIYADNLPIEVQMAVKERRALVGMDREQVVLALGRPNQKSRETKDGVELEDWVYGEAPGKFTFVTFNGDKVVKVKESYAGLGTQVAGPPPVK